MSWDYGEWPRYVSAGERRLKVARAMAKLSRKGVALAPVAIEGRTIARTFWGKAWCANLESYRDYENRLPRGRTYLRGGAVLDLQIAPREVTARVSGSRATPYTVKVTVADLAKARWKALCADCAGGIDSLVELLQGRFSEAVMERICRQGSGLFPSPREIRFACSCPDHATMCKHVAAVLYGVGARLDLKPELLFRLRAVDETEMLSNLGAALGDATAGRDTAMALRDDDLAALFDLELAQREAPDAAAAGSGRKSQSKPRAKPDAPTRIAEKKETVGCAEPIGKQPAAVAGKARAATRLAKASSAAAGRPAGQAARRAAPPRT
jgi:uncharacterized Zn finger protein